MEPTGQGKGARGYREARPAIPCADIGKAKNHNKKTPAEGRGRGPGIGQSAPTPQALKYPQKEARKTGVYIGGVYNACCHDKAGGYIKRLLQNPAKVMQQPTDEPNS